MMSSQNGDAEPEAKADLVRIHETKSHAAGAMVKFEEGDRSVRFDENSVSKTTNGNGIRGRGSPTRSVASESEMHSKGHWWTLLGSFKDVEEENNWLRDTWWDTMAFWSKFFETCGKVPLIPIGTFIFFGMLCAGSVSIVFWYHNREKVDRKEAAQAIANSLASALSAQIDLVLLPLFSLAVDVLLDPTLFTGAHLVQQWPINRSTSPATHRIPLHNNETIAYADRFNQIASDIQALVTTSKAIMNIQVAPVGVVGWVYPPEGSENARGHDLLLDPSRIPDAVRTIKAQKFVFVGPVPLVQGGNMMIGRLPVFAPKSTGMGIDTQDIPLIGETVQEDHLFWGFCVSLINFQTLLAETHFEDELLNHQMRYNLTRIDRVLDADGTVTETRKVVASSAPLEGKEANDPANLVEGVEVEVEFHEEKMTLMVTCPREGCDPTWKWWAILVSVLGSLVLSCMVLVVLVMRAQHKLLLEKMLPRKAIKKINRGKQVIDEFQTVTIFFSDIVGFTSMAGAMSPIDVMRMLNDLYQAFDKLVDKHKVYKVETIGDAYMVVCGAPEPCQGPETAYRVASFALDCLETVKTLETTTGHHIQIRCGVHSGPVVAGVVGTAMPRYCFFGDTVNTASRMESTSTVGRLQISSPTCGFLQVWSHQHGKNPFKITPRYTDGRGVQVKGKGLMETYWVEREGNCNGETSITVRSSSFSNPPDSVRGAGPTTPAAPEAQGPPSPLLQNSSRGARGEGDASPTARAADNEREGEGGEVRLQVENPAVASP